VETAVRRYASKDVRWSSQGMLRLTPEAMQKLFQPTLNRIKDAVANVVNQPAVRGKRPYFALLVLRGIQYLYDQTAGHVLRSEVLL